jgi:DNA (cytosine-5)-methyltransferase 1
MKKIKVGSDFSGVGAFDQALKRLKINYQTIYACDWDKYARETFIHNYGEPKYYPKDVYEREIPSESLDIYMTSPPCQSFSLAGKRLGKDDKRGVLFFNSHEFIQVNKPRYFIFENVKGLLSDDNGKTFSEWIGMLGGKSVNGNPVLFPYENSVPYHLYWKVLNAKEHGIPQNRERVFLIGIRDDQDNNFRFPVEEHLTKRLKDVLEDSVDDKYFLSEKTIENLLVYNERQIKNERGFSAKFRDVNEIKTMDALKVGGGGKDDLIKVKSATSTGFEIATEGDSINFAVPNSETRRGRVGHQVAQTLDTGCQQGVMVGDYRLDEGFRWRKDENCPTIPARAREDGSGQPVIMQLNNSKHSQQAIISYSRDNKGKVISRHIKHESNTIHTATGGGGNTDQFIINDYRIRRLTPRECFRLMDFPDSFTWPVSDSQAYKQAGNSIVVNVLVKIINKLNL